MAVVITSVVTVRRRLSYRAWHAVHIGAYVAIALGFSHQLATGHEFLGQPLARAYWWALYAVTLAALVSFRVVLPVARSLRHRLRIERVVPEAPGVVSLEIGGVRPRPAARALRPVAALALPRARALVGDPPVLPVGRAGRAPAAHHGQGAGRLHTPARLAGAGHAGHRRGSLGRADQRGAPACARRPHRGRAWASRRSARCSRTLPGDAGDDRRRLPRGARGRRPLARRARRARAAARRRACTTSWATRRGDELLSAEHLQAARPRHRRAATSTSAARRSDDRGHAREPARAPASPRRQIISEGFALVSAARRCARAVPRVVATAGVVVLLAQRPRAPAADPGADAAAAPPPPAPTARPRCGA